MKHSSSCCVLWFFSIAMLGCTPAMQRNNDPYAALSASDVYLRKGVEYMNIGNYKVARQDLERAITLDRHNSEAHNALAVLSEKLEQTTEAEHHYQQALQLDPENQAARNNYGRLLCQSGRKGEAMQAFATVIASRLYNHPELALTNAGQCAESQGDAHRAEDYYREALLKETDFPPALLALARLNQARGDSLRARGFLTRYLDISPADVAALRMGIAIENSLGNPEAAAGYRQTLEQTPGNGSTGSPRTGLKSERD